MTKERIEELQTEVEALVSKEVDHTNHLEIMDKINRVSTYLSTGAQCITESKRQELTKRGAWLRQHMETIGAMKPSVAKDYVNTACIDEQILVIRCERNYSALRDCGEFLRSILSMIKADLYQLNN